VGLQQALESCYLTTPLSRLADHIAGIQLDWLIISMMAIILLEDSMYVCNLKVVHRRCQTCCTYGIGAWTVGLLLWLVHIEVQQWSTVCCVCFHAHPTWQVHCAHWPYAWLATQLSLSQALLCGFAACVEPGRMER
jgi:hypothetical protein